MSRIPPAAKPTLFARLVYWIVKRRLGSVPSSLRIAANHGRVLKGQVEMERALLGARTLNPTIKHLVDLRVATQIGCAF